MEKRIMEIITLCRRLYGATYNFKAMTIGYNKFRKQSEVARIVLQNRIFKNIHSGQRCFIIGNGPSLKNEQLSLLEYEYVFTVNQAARIKDFVKIKPTYHFWADPTFFQDKASIEYEELISIMKSVNTKDNKPICFFPADQYGFIKKHGIDKELDFRLFKSGIIFYDSYNKSIDYTRFVPGFGTVVQWCITMAIYMGFKEIYLLGCDNTGLMCTFNSALKMNNDNFYGYEISENEQKRMEQLLSINLLEAYVQSYLRTLKDYRKLYSYCTSLGIKLVNCSSETVIDSIPRKPLHVVINEEDIP